MHERRFIVWDGDGFPVGSFADFDAGHEFAHMRVREPHSRPPIEVEDRRRRVSRRVDVGRCELVVWQEFASLSGCDLPAPRADAGRRADGRRGSDAPDSKPRDQI